MTTMLAATSVSLMLSTAANQSHTLSLHDALPILTTTGTGKTLNLTSLTADGDVTTSSSGNQTIGSLTSTSGGIALTSGGRLEAHTLELQSRGELGWRVALDVTDNLTAANATGNKV